MVELTPFQERLYVILDEKANAGEVCPASGDLAVEIGCSDGAIAGILNRLQLSDMVQVERINRSDRIITITATGKSTADPRPTRQEKPAPKEGSIRQIAFNEAAEREKRFRNAMKLSGTRLVDQFSRSTPADGRRASGVCWYCGSRQDACQCREGAR